MAPTCSLLKDDIAGIPMENVYGSRTGVYSGSMADDYKHVITKDVDDVPKYTATGVSVNMTANRLSWFFNFIGPSISMDSACSSSLMALDFAVQGLRNGSSDMVGLLSPAGRCRTDVRTRLWSLEVARSWLWNRS